MQISKFNRNTKPKKSVTTITKIRIYETKDFISQEVYRDIKYSQIRKHCGYED